MRTSNNLPDKINIKNYEIFNNSTNNNIVLYDNISNNVIMNHKNNMSVNSQNKKMKKKRI